MGALNGALLNAWRERVNQKMYHYRVRVFSPDSLSCLSVFSFFNCNVDLRLSSAGLCLGILRDQQQEEVLEGDRRQVKW